jgi:hypothetical protein
MPQTRVSVPQMDGSFSGRKVLGLQSFIQSAGCCLSETSTTGEGPHSRITHVVFPCCSYSTLLEMSRCNSVRMRFETVKQPNTIKAERSLLYRRCCTSGAAHAKQGVTKCNPGFPQFVKWKDCTCDTLAEPCSISLAEPSLQ